MTPLPFIPTRPDEFVSLMEQIWSTNDKPTGDGGITMHTSPWYDDWHDAKKVARAVGLAHTGNTVMGDERAEVYRFPNMSGVAISASGGAVRLTGRRFGPHKTTDV